MDKPATSESLLASALKDENFLATLREEAPEQWEDLYSALQGGIGHPNAQDAIDRINQLIEENQDYVASYTAKECGEEYLINVYGFDRLCYVWASEYGTYGPFPDFEEAMQFIEQNWMDQIIDEAPNIYKTTKSLPGGTGNNLTPVTPEELQPEAPIHKIQKYKYSRLGPDRFKRHHQGFFDGDEILTTEQFVLRFSKGREAEDKILHQEISAAGWPEIAAEGHL